MEPIASSTGLASICRSTGFASKGLTSSDGGNFLDGGDVGVLLWGLLVFCRLVERPLRRRRNDSRNDFLKDLRREIGVSPAPVRSKGKKWKNKRCTLVFGRKIDEKLSKINNRSN